MANKSVLCVLRSLPPHQSYLESPQIFSTNALLSARLFNDSSYLSQSQSVLVMFDLDQTQNVVCFNVEDALDLRNGHFRIP